MGEFLRAEQQALDETEHLGVRAERVVGDRFRVRQAARDPLAPAAKVQERPERRRARVRAQLLVGELDLDGLARALESDRAAHRRVNRADARGLLCFHPPPVSSPTAAPFRLHRIGLAGTMQ